MESLITSYGIDFHAFQEIINRESLRVSGSAALAGYLKQEGIEPGFEPPSIDIFIPGQRSYDGEDMTEFLLSYGFTRTENGDVSNFNKDGKSIQVIVADDFNLKEYIIDAFDLSICVSWWNSITNTFETFDSERTKRKEMYLMPGTLRLPGIWQEERIQKYVDRGFTLVQTPQPTINTADLRSELDADIFNDIKAYDILTLEDYSIKDFLRASEYNIVLKAGDKYYAFDRNTLMKYMNKKVYYSAIGELYETPFNQCIVADGINAMCYADYSIYELRSAYVVRMGNSVKSLFNLHCYSTNQWIRGEAGQIISPP
jgi:hypothetical protein